MEWSLTQFPLATVTAQGTWVRTKVFLYILHYFLSNSPEISTKHFSFYSFGSKLCSNHHFQETVFSASSGVLSPGQPGRPTESCTGPTTSPRTAPPPPQTLRNDSGAALGSALSLCPRLRTQAVMILSPHLSKWGKFFESFPHIKHHTKCFTYISAYGPHSNPFFCLDAAISLFQAQVDQRTEVN